MAHRIYIIAGEKSGDTHGAGLISAMQTRDPELDFRGAGGPLMAGLADTKDWLADAAVLGLWEVIKKYGYFKSQMEEMVAEAISWEPHTIVLIDYPGFNLRFAERLRSALPDTRIAYYISPQVWAWKKGRIPKMAQLLDLMVCLFPFEEELYGDSGLEATCAGHPMIDRLREGGDPPTREPDLIGLFPGSRQNEIEKLLPPMLEAANILSKELPDLRFEIAAADPTLAATAGEMLSASGLNATCQIVTGESSQLMTRASAGVVASGTATLEAAALGLPYCLVYKVSWLTYRIGRALIQVDHLGMANILAGREIVRELLQDEVTGTGIAAELHRLLTDKSALATLQEDLDHVRNQLGDGNAYDNAAAAILTLAPSKIQP